MSEHEARIRDEAYRMWVEAGRPAGEDHQYWYEAEKRVAASDAAGGKAVKAKEFPQPVREASHDPTPDTGAAKAVSAGQKAAPKLETSDVEGAAAAPAPGPAGAGGTVAAQAIAKNAGNGAVPSPAVAPLKGERVEVAPLKTPRKPTAEPKAR